MDFIQRMIRYFAVVRRQLRRHRRLVVAAAAVVVFATTYALVLPAITMDEQTATETPGMELAGTAESAQDATTEAVATDDAQPAEADADAQATEADATDYAAAEATDAADATDTVETTQALTQQTITATADDGATVEISGQLPEGATASIKPVTLSEDELGAYLGSDVVDGIDSVVVYDISILVDGQEWEPDETVSVVVKNPAGVDADNATVSHLQEDDATQARSAEKMDSQAADGAISFDTDGFSLYAVYTYTVDFYYGDAEWHLAGGTQTTLSQLFQNLSIEASVADVTSVGFTNPELLSVTQTDGEWTLTSLRPFDTEETLTVTMADGTTYEITTKDVQYVKYENSSNMSAYAGSFSYVGKYDIFGGGNGIAGRLSSYSGGSSSYTGTWGYDASGSIINWNDVKGYQVINGTSSRLSGRQTLPNPAGGTAQTTDASNVFVSQSSASITWDGSVERAFFSYGFLWSSSYYNRTGTMWVEITGPNNQTAYVQIDLSNTENDRRSGTYVTNDSSTGDWRYLSFDATDFVKAAGSGTYTVKMTLYRPNNASNVPVGDMGWSIYGVTNKSSDSSAKSVAIAGTVAEMDIDATTSGTANFATAITPSGAGKVWFNVHGGETKGFGRNADYDSLQVITSGDADNIYLGSGSNAPSNSVAVKDTNNWDWDWEDIAKPNSNSAIQNRFAFGMGTFTSLSATSITGVSKTQRSGNDVFGSVMILTEIKDGSGNAVLTKRLSNTSDMTQSAQTFTFTVEPVGTNPGGQTLSQTSFTVTVPVGSAAGTEEQVVIGDFNFNQAGTYVYHVSETAGNAQGWTYDTAVLTLTYDVTYDSSSNSYTGTYTWTDSNGSTLTGDDIAFTNTYKGTGSVSFTKVGDDGSTALQDATFGLYTDAACSTPLQVDGTPATAISGADGTVSFQGVPTGTYYMKESSAPADYQVSDTVYQVTISSTAGGSTIYAYANGHVDTSTNYAASGQKVSNSLKTYDVTIQKVDSSTNEKLSGAEFTLHKEGTSETPSVTRGLTEGKVVIGNDGTAKIEGLKAGSYTLTETKAPDGYVVLTSGITFTVGDDTSGGTTTAKVTLADGTSDSVATASGLTLTVKDTAGQALPNTGGAGNTAFALAGAALSITALLGLALRRRSGRGDA